jgi:hypothetical protein
MRFQINLLFILLLTAVFVACESQPSNNTATTNKPVNAANTNTTTSPVAPTTNNAPTIAPVVQAYHAALKAKDDAALRKTQSQAALKELETEMKKEKETSLVKYLESYEETPDKPFEARNETINGDTATAEIKNSEGVWSKFKFVKENGEWKYAAPSENLKLESTGTAK